MGQQKMNKINRNCHLLIIWSESVPFEKQILAESQKYFDIVSSSEINWTNFEFKKNLTRFYMGKKISILNKIATCGNGTFKAIILEDKKPKFEISDTNSGPQYVNLNVLKLKNKLRKNKKTLAIHITNNYKELARDIQLLDIARLEQDIIKDSVANFKGSKEWNSFSELFETLNQNISYVVLRNYEDILSDQINSETSHLDIDLMVADVQKAAQIINGTLDVKWFPKNRVCYKVNVNGQNVNFDLRSPTDGYYCYKWSLDILRTRKKFKSFFIPSERLHLYGLLYHAIIHKRKIASDYLKTFNEAVLNGDLPLEESRFDHLGDILEGFMLSEGYLYTVPNDRSVYFNEDYFQKTDNTQKIKIIRRQIGPRRLFKVLMSNMKLCYPLVVNILKLKAK